MKPFNLEEAKKGKPFGLGCLLQSSGQTTFIGVHPDGRIVYACSGNASIFASDPEDLVMLPEKKIFRGILVNSNFILGPTVLRDTSENRACAAQDGMTILKMFEIEYET